MSFKNAFKILISRFNLVWSVLLYLTVFIVIICSLAMAFLVPIVKTLGEFGIFENLKAVIETFIDGGSWKTFSEGIERILRDVSEIFSKDTTIVINSTLLIALVVVFAGRFLFGLYEIPLAAAIQSRMSANAKMPFLGCVVTNFKKSIKFTLVKMIYTILFDTIILLLVIATYKLLKVTGLIILAPFALMLVLVLTNAVKYSIKVYCAPMAIMEEEKTVKGFLNGMSKSFADFGRVFSSYIIAWLLAISINILVLFLTFGVGFFVTFPVTLVFFSVLDMTLYYKVKSMRYYIDDNNVISE